MNGEASIILRAYHGKILLILTIIVFEPLWRGEGLQKRILYILEYLLFYTEPMNSIRQRFSILNTPPARKGEEIKAKILHSREIWAYSNQCVCRNLSFPKITLPSGSSEGNFMWVQVPSSAPGRSRCKDGADFLYIVLVIRWWRRGDADEGKRTIRPIFFDE